MNRFELSPDLKNLPVIYAEPWVQIAPGMVAPTMEGAAFDRQGNLLVCHRNRPWSNVVRIHPDKSFETIYHNDDAILIGVAIHKDGRIFLVDIDGKKLYELSPEGTEQRELFSLCGHPIKANDLAFDREGNLYVSEFEGDRNDPRGAIWRLEADSNYTAMNKIVGGLACPNGVAFSPDYSLLWTGETTRNCVTRIMLDEMGHLSRHFLAVHPTYQCIGFEVTDSNKADADGNIYTAMMYGGRVLVTNSVGVPIANVLLRDREEGACMFSPNLAIKPGTKEGYIVTSGTAGAWIYKFETLAPCAPLFSEM